MKWNLLLLCVAFFALGARAEIPEQMLQPGAAAQPAQNAVATQTTRGIQLARFLWGAETSQLPNATMHAPPGVSRKEVGDKDVILLDRSPANERVTVPQVLERKGKEVTNGRNVVAGLQFDPRYLEGTNKDVSNKDVSSTLRQGKTSVSHTANAPQFARYLWERKGQNGQNDRKEMRTARYLWRDGNDQRTLNKGAQVARYLWQGKTSDDLGTTNNGLTADNLRNTFAMFLWRDDRVAGGTPATQRPYVGKLAPQMSNESVSGSVAWDPSDTYQAIASTGKPVLVLKTRRFIVVSKDLKQLKVQLKSMGANVDVDMSFINAVGVSLTRQQMMTLQRDPNVVSITADRAVRTADAKSGVTAADVPNSDEVQHGMHRQTFFTRLIQADKLQREGITGRGVTVAVIDSGLWDNPALTENTQGHNRVLAYYDAIKNRTSVPMIDPAGHGSHIASVLASSEPSYDRKGQRTGSWQGVAPDANLVVVRAFDKQGRGTYMNVIRAVAYVIAHKTEYNIKVMNLSFASAPRSHYWQDPLALAVMAAWRAGIVVVVSSGNSGSDAQTIGVPGNVPYVITVGAMTDNYTLKDTSDDYLATFSSRGPTMEGFVKPELIAPGGHLTGIMSPTSYIAREHPEFSDGGFYFLMSGTSQAAAVTSGVAALMFQVDPNLTPDDVKCRLMSSAKVARNSDGSLGYSVFEQGAGLINAVNAVDSKASGCVNQGLDIAKDMDDVQHYGGPARPTPNGDFKLASTAGYAWDDANKVEKKGSFTWKTGKLASVNAIWNKDYVWNDRALVQNSNVWDQNDFNSNGYHWDMAGLEAKGHILDMAKIKATSQHSVASESNAATPDVKNKATPWRHVVHRSNGSVWDIGNVPNAGLRWHVAFNNGDSYVWNVGYVWNQHKAKDAGYFWNLGTSKNTHYIWNLADSNNTGYFWNLTNSKNAGYFWNLAASNNSGYFWNLANSTNAGYFWNLSNSSNTGYFWNLANSQNAGYFWNLSDSKNAGYFWNLANSKNAGYFWNLANSKNAGYFWNLSDAKNAGYFWNLANSKNAGYFWNLSDSQNAGYFWNLANSKNAGYFWNLANSKNAGYFWNLANSKNAGYFWNLANSKNAGYFWNLSDSKNAGYFWNLANSKNAGYFWNLANSKNAGYFWNLSDSKNAGYFWNLANSKNAGYFWNLANSKNAGYFWNLANSKNAGYFWNLSDSKNAGYFWNLSDSKNAGYFWNLANSKNAGYFWNLSDSHNTGYFWNLNMATNTGYFWNLSDSQNTGYFWNLSSPHNTGSIQNMSVVSTNHWVAQE